MWQIDDAATSMVCDARTKIKNTALVFDRYEAKKSKK